MTRLARAFVAVVPPDPVLDALDSRLASHTHEPSALRWLPRHQWHITLAFLGGVDDVGTLHAALNDATRAWSPFTLQLGVGGAFPDPRRASVLWIGLAPQTPPIMGLATAVRDAATGLSDHAEDRPFHPHLTVARAPRPRPLTDLIDAIGAEPIGPPWTVTGLALIESDTRPTGAVHTVRDELALGGP